MNRDDERNQAASAPLHPIAAVARRTGLSPHVLRAWERRYGAVDPVRTGGGARLYSEADVVKLTRLRRAVEAGYGIARAVALSPDELLDVSGPDDTAEPLSISGRRATEAEGVVDACLTAAREMDTGKVHAALSRALVSLGAAEFGQSVVVPLMRRIGELWAEGEVCPAHEHAVTFQVRLILNAVLVSLPAENGAPIAVVTTPRQQLHEVGALLSAIEAAEEGWRVIYLGPNLPARDVGEAVRVSQANLILLSFGQETSAREVTSELETLRAAIPESVAILVGGRAADAHSARISAAGAVWLPDMQALRSFLRSMRPESRASVAVGES